MAFVSQELKKELAPQIKEVLKKYGMRGTISVRHHSTLVVSIKAGKLPLIQNYVAGLGNVDFGETVLREAFLESVHYYTDTRFTGVCREFLAELTAAMNKGNYDKSDTMTDYFNVGWYTDIRIGEWNRPYEMIA